MRAKARTDSIRSILVPVDGSASSRRAVQLAAEMSRAFGAKLTLLHVAPIQELPVLMSEAEDPREDREAELVLGEQAKIARGLGVEASVVVRRGRIATQILRHVEGSKPDLVIMGTRGLTGAKSLLLGSVSRSVSRRAQSQVVLVR
jgi:nucleotide-binding universal stress UspA family protein